MLLNTPMLTHLAFAEWICYAAEHGLANARYTYSTCCC